MGPDYSRAFNDLLTAMAVTVGATEAAGFTIDWDTRGLPTLRVANHIRPGDSADATRRAAVAAFTEIVRPCARQRRDGVIHVDDGITPHPDGEQYCLVRVFSFSEYLGSAAAFIVRSRTPQQARALAGRLGAWSSARVWKALGW